MKLGKLLGGVNRRDVSALEKGRRPVSLSIARRASEVFGIMQYLRAEPDSGAGFGRGDLPGGPECEFLTRRRPPEPPSAPGFGAGPGGYRGKQRSGGLIESLDKKLKFQEKIRALERKKKKLRHAVFVISEQDKVMTNKRQERLKGRIDRFSVKGFRSIKDVDKISFPDLAVIIGSNGAGKSNCIKFFEMLSFMLKSQNLSEFVARNGGADDQLFMGVRRTPKMEAEIRIKTELGSNDYKFALTHAASSTGGRLMFVDEAFRYSDLNHPGPADWIQLDSGTFEAGIVDFSQRLDVDPGQKTTARIVVNLLKNYTIYQFHDTSTHSFIKQECDETDNRFMRSHGGNLAPILLRLKNEDIKRYKLIIRQIQRVLPSFGDFELEPLHGKIALRWQHKYGDKYGDKTIGAHLTSDGSLRLFCLMTLLNLPSDMLPDILFLDEPELGLHPYAITLVSEMLQKVSQTRQVFVATQSPYLVDCFDLENIIVAQLKDGATELKTFDKTKYQQWLDDEYQVSDLWLQNILRSEG